MFYLFALKKENNCQLLLLRSCVFTKLSEENGMMPNIRVKREKNSKILKRNLKFFRLFEL